MNGTFYTERDIEDLLRAGHTSLQLRQGDRMTDLARERARKGGLELRGPHESSSQVARQAASVRYAQETASDEPAASPNPGSSKPQNELHQRIKKSVIAKLGQSAEPELLDRIISRVLDQMGLS
jgi:hypothetical protein